MEYPYYQDDASGRFWWCNTHNRKATAVRWIDSNTIKHCCQPGEEGITLPCSCVDITDQIEFKLP